jgi:hypothetical protein
MQRPSCIAPLIAAALLAGSAARADGGAAQAHFDLGSLLYQQGRYDDALGELTAGYKLDPRPEFLYSLGQTERKRGRCKEALDYYQRYLDTGLSRERAAAVLVQMDRCRAELALPPAPPVAAPNAATANAPASATAPGAASATLAPAPAVLVAATPPAPARKPIYKRWWLWTTVAAVAVVGVGVGLGVGLSSPSRTDFKPTLPDLVIK